MDCEDKKMLDKNLPPVHEKEKEPDKTSKMEEVPSQTVGYLLLLGMAPLQMSQAQLVVSVIPPLLLPPPRCNTLPGQYMVYNLDCRITFPFSQLWDA